MQDQDLEAQNKCQKFRNISFPIFIAVKDKNMDLLWKKC